MSFVTVKQGLFVYPEFTPEGLRVTLVDDNENEFKTFVSFDALVDNALSASLSDEQFADVANQLDQLAFYIRDFIKQR